MTKTRRTPTTRLPSRPLTAAALATLLALAVSGCYLLIPPPPDSDSVTAAVDRAVADMAVGREYFMATSPSSVVQRASIRGTTEGLNISVEGTMLSRSAACCEGRWVRAMHPCPGRTLA